MSRRNMLLMITVIFCLLVFLVYEIIICNRGIRFCDLSLKLLRELPPTFFSEWSRAVDSKNYDLCEQYKKKADFIISRNERVQLNEKKVTRNLFINIDEWFANEIKGGIC
jgi:hypothetical protein